MAKSLLIVESPAKAKTIQKYLGKDYEVMASKGHIKDLPKRGGVDLENDFAETYVVIDEKGKGEIVKTHPRQGQEGRSRPAWPWTRTARVRPSPRTSWRRSRPPRPPPRSAACCSTRSPRRASTRGCPTRATSTPTCTRRSAPGACSIVSAAIPLSSLLWRKLAFGLSAGRVQTPALRLIVDRQREIDAFVPVSYWLVDVALKGKRRARLHGAARLGQRREARACELASGRHHRAGGAALRQRPQARELTRSRASPSSSRAARHPRRTPRPSSSRTHPRAWACSPSARCAWRRGCTRVCRSARAKRASWSVSSPTCVRTACASATTPLPRCAASSRGPTARPSCPRRPTSSRARKSRTCRTRTKPFGPRVWTCRPMWPPSTSRTSSSSSTS